MVASSHSDYIPLSLLIICPNKAELHVNLTTPTAYYGRKREACVHPPPDCASWGPPGWEEPMDPTPPLRSPSLRTLGRVRSSVAGGGGGDSAAAGESRSAWGGGVRERRLRPSLPPEGKGRRWPARSGPDAAASAAGAAGPGPGGTQRVGAGSPPTRSRARSLLLRLPPPRAALSIHKFSACSAATGHRSPPGTPRSRPPARPPWAARPGAEVGAAGPGIQPGGRGQAGAARPTGSPPAPDHRPFPRGGEAGGREWGKLGRAWGPICGALQPSLAAWRAPPAHAFPQPQFPL